MLDVPIVRSVSKIFLNDFCVQSNHLDGVVYDDIGAHADALYTFICGAASIRSLTDYVTKVSPCHVLRVEPGMNLVSEGEAAPMGGRIVRTMLVHLFTDMRYLSSYDAFLRFKAIKPFNGANGRAGRALWLWHMTRYSDAKSFSCLAVDGFLTAFYRQAVRHVPSYVPKVMHSGADTVEIVTQDCAVMWSPLDPRHGGAQVAYSLSAPNRIVGLRVTGLAAADRQRERMISPC